MWKLTLCTLMVLAPLAAHGAQKRAEDRFDPRAERERLNFLELSLLHRVHDHDSYNIFFEAAARAAGGRYLSNWLALEARAEVVTSQSPLPVDLRPNHGSGHSLGGGLRFTLPMNITPFAHLGYRYAQRQMNWSNGICVKDCDDEEGTTESRLHLLDAELGVQFGFDALTLRMGGSAATPLQQEVTRRSERGGSERDRVGPLEHGGMSMNLGYRF